MAINESTHMFTFGSSIGEHLSEGTVTTQADGTMKVAMNGMQSFEEVEIKPGKDSDIKKYLDLTIASATEQQKVRESILTGNSGVFKMILDRLDAIVANKVDKKAIEKKASIKVQGTAEDLVRQAIELAEAAKWYNPIKALSFKFAIKGFATAIADALNIMAKATKGKDFEQLAKPLEFFVALAKLASETKAGDLELTTKYLKFANSQLRLSKKAATNLKNFLEITSTGVLNSINKLAEANVDEAKIKVISTGIKGLLDILEQVSANGKVLLRSWTVASATKMVVKKLVDMFGLINEIEVDEKKERRFANLIDWLVIPISSIPMTFGKKAELFVENAQPLFDVIVGNDGIIAMTNKSKPNPKKAGQISDSVEALLGTIGRIPFTMWLRTKAFVSGWNEIKGVLFSKTGILALIDNSKPNVRKTNQIVKVVNSIVDTLKAIPITLPIKVQTFSWSIDILSTAITKINKLNISKKALSGIDNLATTLSSRKYTQARKNIQGFAIGIATLGLALTGFALLTPMVLIASLGLKVFGWALHGLTGVKSGVQLMIFAGSLALFGLTIWAFGEVVTGESMIKTIGGLFMLWGAIQLFSGGDSPLLKKFGVKGKGKGKAAYKDLMFAATAIATLGLALSYGFKNVTMETALVATASVAGLGIAMKAWSGIKINKNSALTMVYAAGGIGALALGLQAWRLVNAGMLAMAVVGTAAIVGIFYLWKAAKVTKTNVMNMVMAAGAVGAMGLALLPYNMVSAQDAITAGLFMTAVTGNLVLLSKFGGPMALIGATALAIAGGAIALIGVGLNKVPKDGSVLLNTGLFMGALSAVMLGLGALAPIALLGASALVVAGGVMLALGSALGKMAKAGVTEENVDVAKYALLSFADVFGNNKMLMVKSSIGAAAFMPTALTLIPLTGVLRMLSRIDSDPDKLRGNISLLKLFIHETANTFGGLSLKTMAKVWLGVKAVSDLGSTVKSLAEGISAVSELKFYEYEVKDGKLQIKSARAFTDADFNNVGVGLGKMISALTGPLAEIGAKQDKGKFLGMSFPMPWGNDVKRGIKALDGLGNLIGGLAQGLKVAAESGAKPEVLQAFGEVFAYIIEKLQEPFAKIGATQDGIFDRPDAKRGVKAMEGVGEIISDISEGIKTAADSGKDPKVLQEFGSSIAFIISEIQKPFAEIGKSGGVFKKPDAQKGVKALNGLSEILNPIMKGLKFFVKSDKNKKDVSTIDKFNNMISSMATDSRWTKAFTNMTTLANKVKAIANNFNLIDLQKLTVMHELSKNLKEANDDNKMLVLIDKILELIKVIETKKEEAPVTNNSSVISSVNSSNSSVTNNNGKHGATQAVQQTQGNRGLLQAIEDLRSEVEDLRSHVFKVRLVDRSLSF